MAARAASTTMLSALASWCLPNGRWLQPTMQAVMGTLLGERSKDVGRRRPCVHCRCPRGGLARSATRWQAPGNCHPPSSLGCGTGGWGRMGSGDERIGLVEEQLEVGTREVDRGRVRIRTKVDTREELVEAALRQDDVAVERVPIGRLLDAVPAVREEDGVLIVPVLEERLVVTKQLFLKEEVRVSSRTRLETVRQPVLLRSERVELSRDEPPDPDNPDHTRQELNDGR